MKMGHSSLRAILTDRFNASPTRYSSVGSDDASSNEAELKHAPPPRTRCLAALKLPLALLLCALLSSAATSLTLRSFPPACQKERLIKTPVPDFPKEVRLFELDHVYSDPPTPETDAAWNALLPVGRGYVYVDKPETYGLEPGVETQWGSIFSVSMYHQMHCLGLVRRNYWRLLNGILENSTTVHDEALHQVASAHTGHCFDYFRQSFECSADMTLEWPRVEEDGRRFQVDGAGIPHVCASRHALREYMNAHYFNNSVISDIAA